MAAMAELQQQISELEIQVKNFYLLEQCVRSATSDSALRDASYVLKWILVQQQGIPESFTPLWNALDF